MAEGEQQQQQQARPIGARALEAAIVLGDRDAVEKILDSGVSLAVLDDDDSSTTTRGCLHLLIDHPEAMTHVLPLLLARGARLDLQDAEGDTPLHRFVRLNTQQAVATLLAHGADPNARNPRTGDTPLHVAAREGNEDAMALLIALGAADEEATNEEGLRPRDLHRLSEG